MSILNKKLVFDCFLIVIVASTLLPEIANACSCKAHFEIVWREVSPPFKPDVPSEHFEAHQARRKGETENACRRRAREAAQSCMSNLWRDRWLLQEGDPNAAADCRLRLGESTVIRPLSVSRMDLKRELERASCCGDSPMSDAHSVTAEIYKRTYGDLGCGPQIMKSEMRFLTDYTFDCKSVRARENCGSVELSGAREEEGYDRLGEDLPGMPIPDVTSAGNCRARCIKEHRCRAWTWVKPGIQGPAANCWLKDKIPWAQKNDCCFSGTVR